MSKRKDRLTHTRFRIGAAHMQPDRLAIILDGEEHAVEPRIMEVLIHLAENAGATHSAEAILLEVAHADVFHGRSRMVAECLTAMRRQIEHQRRFILAVGASGCSKTSLLNAGVVPRLRQPGGFDGLDSFRNPRTRSSASSCLHGKTRMKCISPMHPRPVSYSGPIPR